MASARPYSIGASRVEAPPSPARPHRWVNDPKAAQEQIESITRPTIGVAECPVPGIPVPRQETPTSVLGEDKDVPAGRKRKA